MVGKALPPLNEARAPEEEMNQNECTDLYVL